LSADLWLRTGGKAASRNAATVEEAVAEAITERAARTADPRSIIGLLAPCFFSHPSRHVAQREGNAEAAGTSETEDRRARSLRIRFRAPEG
jgi:hypothetical protein